MSSSSQTTISYRWIVERWISSDLWPIMWRPISDSFGLPSSSLPSALERHFVPLVVRLWFKEGWCDAVASSQYTWCSRLVDDWLLCAVHPSVDLRRRASHTLSLVQSRLANQWFEFYKFSATLGVGHIFIPELYSSANFYCDWWRHVQKVYSVVVPSFCFC